MHTTVRLSCCKASLLRSAGTQSSPKLSARLVTRLGQDEGVTTVTSPCTFGTHHHPRLFPRSGKEPLWHCNAYIRRQELGPIKSLARQHSSSTSLANTACPCSCSCFDLRSCSYSSIEASDEIVGRCGRCLGWLLSHSLRRGVNLLALQTERCS